jgi:hypothetical protein
MRLGRLPEVGQEVRRRTVVDVHMQLGFLRRGDSRAARQPGLGAKEILRKKAMAVFR